MAVVSIQKSTTMSIKVQTGISGTGAPVYGYRNYGRVKPAATHADIFAVAVAMTNLQKHPVNSIQRIDTGDLMNQ